MATILSSKPRAPDRKPLAPDPFERILSVGAVVLLACILIAVAKGRAQWGMVPVIVWPHLLTIVIAVVLTPVMLLRRRGDGLHRQLGWVWAAAMPATALSSFFIRDTNNGGFSIIHILLVWTLLQVPLIVWSARTHNIARHRGSVRRMVTGALLVAGFFTFPFDRLLGQWLFG